MLANCSSSLRGKAELIVFSLNIPFFCFSLGGLNGDYLNNRSDTKCLLFKLLYHGGGRKNCKMFDSYVGMYNYLMF